MTGYRPIGLSDEQYERIRQDVIAEIVALLRTHDDGTEYDYSVAANFLEFGMPPSR